MKVRTIDIEIAIMEHFNFLQNTIVPNITNQMGVLPFETDMLVLSKAGYATGFEIKVSKGDLKADFNKPQYKGWTKNLLTEEITPNPKYYKKFKYFYFAVSKDIEDDALELIPECFGVYSLDINNKYYSGQSFKMIRNAKVLSNYKWSEEDRINLMRLGTMRIYSLKKSIAKTINK